MSVQGWSVDVRDVQTSPAQKENDHRFQAPAGRVLTGRRHQGDEHGDTWYHHAQLVVVTPQGEFPAHADTASWSAGIRESSGNPIIVPDSEVLVGREHEGDENGYTRYASASFSSP